MPAADSEQVNSAVDSAHRAFRNGDWANLSSTDRSQFLHRIADLILQHSDHLARLDSQDSGKTIRETTAQTAYIANYYRYYAGLADKLEGSYLPVDQPESAVWLQREPKGVVAAIIPWNSPLFLSAVKLGPAIAAGCTLVLKASEEAPAVMLEFAKLIDRAGIPPESSTSSVALEKNAENRLPPIPTSRTSLLPVDPKLLGIS